MVTENGKILVQRLTWDKAQGTYVVSGEPAEVNDTKSDRVKVPAQTPTNRFLRGPVPWNWVVRAASLPGQALVVGLCLWRLKGSKNSETIMLANLELTPFGVDRAAKSRALAALEEAGLITVAHHRGRFPIVTLLTSNAWQNHEAGVRNRRRPKGQVRPPRGDDDRDSPAERA